ncbi:hypothetical protein Ancab_038720 [Ancistrocladus abbreviatus]
MEASQGVIGQREIRLSVVFSSLGQFDLEKERSLLDEQGRRIAENQENSQKLRRKLAESTGDFKKASAEEKLNLFNSLLKGYQEEVDNLTKKAKFGENAFLNIYQKLYEAPDPYPALASIVRKVELDEFRTEATHLKNQQATIRRLEECNHQLEQQGAIAADQLHEAQESVTTMQKLHELAQSQLSELRTQSEEDRAAKQSELNLLMDEVERAQSRLLKS